MSNQEALQQVHDDSNACDSASVSSGWIVPSEPSEVHPDSNEGDSHVMVPSEPSEVHPDSNECDSHVMAPSEPSEVHPDSNEGESEPCEVHPDSNEGDSHVMVPSEPSEVSSVSRGGERARQPDVAEVRKAQTLEHLRLTIESSERHLLQLEERRHEAAEAFKQEWQLTHDRLGIASMASDLEACLEAARDAPLEHPTGLLGHYAQWHHEVQQESARLHALREDQQLCAGRDKAAQLEREQSVLREDLHTQLLTKEWVNEHLGQLQSDATASHTQLKAYVDEQLRGRDEAIARLSKEMQQMQIATAEGTMDAQRKQSEEFSEVVSALRKEMDAQLAEKDARVAQLESEQSVLRGFVDELRLEVGAMKKSLDDERQVRTKSMEAMTEKMATKEWVNEQVGQLQSDASASLDSTVKDAVDSVMQDGPTEKGRPVDVGSKLQLLQGKNPHAVDVLAHVSYDGEVQCAVQLVLCDGSLVGPPAKTKLKSTAFHREVADVAGLRRLVEERLASNGLDGARMMYARNFWCDGIPQPLVHRALSLPDLQRLLRRRDVRITETGEVIDNDN